MEGDLADIIRGHGNNNSSSKFSGGMMVEEDYRFRDAYQLQVELDGAPESLEQMVGADSATFQMSAATTTSSSRSSDLFQPSNLQPHLNPNIPPTSPSSPKPPSHLLDAPRVQICSPATPIAKRRKSQSKKVVCIPAPTTAANNRQGVGEVVPSDLWAWRKYGQKPIKGSPHPRGYYRCSSSKGCSARKQVERSRTDPNMLVITYTSEHNHPWPTQRNSLAGSTRIPSKPLQPTQLPGSGSIKGETTHLNSSAEHPVDAADRYHHLNCKGFNELVGPDQLILLNDIMLDNPTPTATSYDDDIDNPVAAVDFHHLEDHGHGNYSWDHDLFADLRDLEGDPLSLLFPGARSSFTTTPDFDRPGGSKSMFDPFTSCCNLFDWSTSNSNPTTTANRRTHQNS